MGTLFEVILRFRGFADRLYDVAMDAAMRLQLAQLLARPCNLLVLDEPTNDLDV